MKRAEKTLIIDAQVFQAEAWHRGMGKYSLALVRALVQEKFTEGYGTVRLLFNSNLPLADEPKGVLEKLVPGAESLYVALDVPTLQKQHISDLRTNNKRSIDEALVKENIDSPDYLILSLFIDETCMVFPTNGVKLLVFYDLIPLLYHGRYSNRINFSGYLDHFATIFEADCVFSISQTVGNDNNVYLGLSKEKLVTIDGASIDRSQLPAVKPDIALPEKFILMPSGDELRKNNLNAVKGFEEFNAANGESYKLVITSRFSDYTRDELSHYSDNLLFTGNVKEEELQWLYENAEAILFASEYEGLGLPILEAMSVTKRIACSDIPVFREISTEAFYMFNELNPASIAQALGAASRGDDWASKRKHYPAVLGEYTWTNTAHKFIKGYEKVVDATTTEVLKKPRIAIITPHPSGYSAIGKVVAESHDAYSSQFDIDYYFDYGPYHREVRPDFLSHIATCYDAANFNAATYKQYDAVVYHIGNSDYHLESIRAALHLPGYIIMHDTYLDGAFETLERIGYIDEERMKLEKDLNLLGPEGGSFLTSLITNQIGVVTHSKYAADIVNKVIGDDVTTACKEIALPVSTPVDVTSKTETSFQIGLAGIIADVKGLQIIEDLAALPEFNECTINIFGHSFAKPEIEQQFKRWANVHVFPNPSDFEFQTKLSGLDILINYRLEYRGETSLTTLEAMRYGVPVVVRDIGWYSELPDNAVMKAASNAEVIEKVDLLNLSEAARKKIGEAARKHTDSHHGHKNYALQLAKLIDATSKSKQAEMAKKIRQSESLKDIL